MQTKTLAAALLAAITLSMAGAGFAQSQTRAAGSDTAAASKPAGERPRAHGMRGHHRMGNPVDALARLDTDNDGRISRAEAQAAQAKSAERFDERDVNKDGYLDRADMQARMAQRRGECFAKADADKNGQLSRAEFDRMGEACGRMHGDKRMPRNNPNPGPLPPKK